LKEVYHKSTRELLVSDEDISNFEATMEKKVNPIIEHHHGTEVLSSVFFLPFQIQPQAQQPTKKLRRSLVFRGLPPTGPL